MIFWFYFRQGMRALSQKQISSRTRISNKESQDLERPFDKHIDNKELNALVPSPSESGQELQGLSPDAVREAERHVRSCEDCRRKVSKYWQLVNPVSPAAVSESAPPGADCPKREDVDWH